MRSSHLRRSLAAVAATAMTGALLTVATPSAEAAAFTASTWDHYQYAGLQSGNCTMNFTPADPANTPIPTDGTASTKVNTLTYSATNNGDNTDVLSTVAKQTSTAQMWSHGNEPARISMRFTGTASTTSTKATSACTTQGNTSSKVEFAFTLTRPTWVDTTMTRRGSAYSEIYLYNDDTEPYVDLYGQYMDHDATQRVYLPAGNYGGYLEADVNVPRSNTARSATASGAMTMTFTPAGSRTAAPAGKGKKFVTLPAMRGCSAGTVSPQVTAVKRNARKIDRIVFKVNGRTVKKTSKAKAGKVFALPAPAAKAVTVKAVVKLESGRTVSVSAPYVACRN